MTPRYRGFLGLKARPRVPFQNMKSSKVHRMMGKPDTILLQNLQPHLTALATSGERESRLLNGIHIIKQHEGIYDIWHTHKRRFLGIPLGTSKRLVKVYGHQALGFVYHA